MATNGRHVNGGLQNRAFQKKRTGRRNPLFDLSRSAPRKTKSASKCFELSPMLVILEKGFTEHHQLPIEFLRSFSILHHVAMTLPKCVPLLVLVFLCNFLMDGVVA